MIRRVMMAALVGALGLTSARMAGAQTPGPRVSGVLEFYFWAYQEDGQVETDQRARWLSVNGTISKGLGFTAGQLAMKGFTLLDETCLEIGGDDGRLRVGRFRPAFGIFSWDDNWYGPLPHAPVARSASLGNGLIQARLDSGAQVSGGRGSLQYQVGIVDDASNRYQIMPKRPNHLVSRLQTDKGNVILGFNSLVSMANAGPGGTRLFGLDWRWTVPQIQVRGEVFGGRYRGGNISAYYADLYYHPIGLYRTTFALRAEAAAGRQGAGQLYTIGARQVLSKALALQFSQAWGNALAPTESFRGWTMQAVTSAHF